MSDQRHEYDIMNGLGYRFHFLATHKRVFKKQTEVAKNVVGFGMFASLLGFTFATHLEPLHWWLARLHSGPCAPFLWGSRPEARLRLAQAAKSEPNEMHQRPKYPAVFDRQTGLLGTYGGFLK